MSNANPYRAPVAEIADIPQDGELELAGIGHRFGALVLDGVILLAVLLPIAYATGNFDFVMDSEDSYTGSAEITGIAFVLFIVIQSYFLKKHGQTIGKKIVGIRMVDRDGNLPGLGRLLFRRYLPIHLYNALPFAGLLLAIIDFVLVFRRDRRCLHDLLAGTRVVMHNAKHSSITWFIAPVLTLIGGTIAISVIEPMLDNPTPPPAVHAKKQPAPNHPATPNHPAAPKPPVQTAAAHGTPAGTPTAAPKAAPPEANPPQAAPAHTSPPEPATPPAAHHSVLTQATATPAPAADPAPETPAIVAPVESPAARAKLRKCAALSGAAAIIRCSQAVH